MEMSLPPPVYWACTGDRCRENLPSVPVPSARIPTIENGPGGAGSNWLTLNEGGDHLLDANVSLDRIRAAAGEIDPSFVEPIQHTNARTRVFHPLRAEQTLPCLAGHDFGSHG